MTDRELLELAAKAAGIEHLQTIEGEPFEYFGGWLRLNDDGQKWNPLTDDGDALRLAVKIRAGVNVYPTKVCVTADGVFVQVMSQEANYDLAATTRRAIVRAAAEIGKDSK